MHFTQDRHGWRRLCASRDLDPACAHTTPQPSYARVTEVSHHRSRPPHWLPLLAIAFKLALCFQRHRRGWRCGRHTTTAATPPQLAGDRCGECCSCDRRFYSSKPTCLLDEALNHVAQWAQFSLFSAAYRCLCLLCVSHGLLQHRCYLSVASTGGHLQDTAQHCRVRVTTVAYSGTDPASPHNHTYVVGRVAASVG